MYNFRLYVLFHVCLLLTVRTVILKDSVSAICEERKLLLKNALFLLVVVGLAGCAILYLRCFQKLFEGSKQNVLRRNFFLKVKVVSCGNDREVSAVDNLKKSS